MWGKLFFAPEIIAGTSRWGVFWRGLLVFAVGILIALEPLLTAFTLAIWFGWGMLLGGIWIFASPFFHDWKWGWAFYGILTASAGLLLIFCPKAGLIAFAWCIAGSLIGSGIIGISCCLKAECSSAETLFGFISAVFGVLLGFLLFWCPVSGMTEMFWLLGILTAVGGLAQILFSFRIRGGAGGMPEQETVRKRQGSR